MIGYVDQLHLFDGRSIFCPKGQVTHISDELNKGVESGQNKQA
jgi:hypothetical protein